MDEFMAGVVAAFLEDVEGTALTPSAAHLFQIRNDDDKDKKRLSEEQTGLFYHVIAKLLFASFRVRRDL